MPTPNKPAGFTYVVWNGDHAVRRQCSLDDIPRVIHDEASMVLSKTEPDVVLFEWLPNLTEQFRRALASPDTLTRARIKAIATMLGISP